MTVTIFGKWLDALERGTADASEVIAYWDRWNAIVGECMKEDGFEYEPFVDRWAVDRRIALGLTREQFVEQYGNGLTTLIDYLPAGTQPVDPNRVAVQHMSDQEAAAWRARMVTCRRDADAELGPAPHVASIGMTAEQAEYTEKIEGAVEADERVAAALDTRNRCIEEQGFDSHDSASLPLHEAASEFLDRFEAALWERALAGQETSTLRVEDVFSAEELTELRKLKEQEIAQAVATQPCQWVYDDVYRDVYAEYLDRAMAGEL